LLKLDFANYIRTCKSISSKPIQPAFKPKQTKLTPEQNQSELQRHRAILLAACDYLLKRNRGCFVVDGADQIAESFEQEKERIEQHFQQGNLKELQRELQRRTAMFSNRVDLQFVPYIKETTGYDLDLFAALHSRMDGIIAQKQIHTEKERNDVHLLLRAYEHTGEAPREKAILESLLKDYYDRTRSAGSSLQSQTSDRVEVIRTVVKDGVEEQTFRMSTGPKPAHHKEEEAIAPDGKRKLCVTQWSDGQGASTYVSIHFPTANGAVFGSEGINPEVKGYWKDNNTIVIEYRKEYPVNTKHYKVSSFDDVVMIEYIEH
jgi:hypothetical protein